MLYYNNFGRYCVTVGTRGVNSVWWLANGWTVRGLNRSGDRILSLLHTRPDRPWGPHSLPYNGYQGFLREIKGPGRDVDHPTRSSTEVYAWVKLYSYTLCLHWLFPGATFYITVIGLNRLLFCWPSIPPFFIGSYWVPTLPAFRISWTKAHLTFCLVTTA